MSPPLHQGIWMYLSVPRRRARGCVRAFASESDVTRTNRYHVDARIDGIRKHGLHRHDAWMLHTAGDHDLYTTAGE